MSNLVLLEGKYPHGITSVDAREILGDENDMKIGHKTYLYRINNGVGGFGITYHDTTIITIDHIFHAELSYDGDVYTLNHGGWDTPTTKDRMNKLLPNARVNQVNHIWYVGEEEYYNGMVINKHGEVWPMDTHPLHLQRDTHPLHLQRSSLQAEQRV